MNIRAHVFVSGKVQGVFFRSSTRDKAQEFGITGWVRNLGEGRVEAVFEGEQERVERMIQWCKTGPQYARVEGIEVIPEKYKGEFPGFIIRY
jgi:acylphosphatase